MSDRLVTISHSVDSHLPRSMDAKVFFFKVRLLEALVHRPHITYSGVTSGALHGGWGGGLFLYHSKSKWESVHIG